MPDLELLLGSLCMRHIGLEHGEDYRKAAQGRASGQLLLVFVFQHCQFLMRFDQCDLSDTSKRPATAG